MSTTTEDRQETMLLDQLTERYCASLAPPTPTEVDRGLSAFMARLESTATRRSHIRRWSLVAASMALVAVLVQGGSMLGRRSSGPEAPPLTYQLDGGSVVEGGYLRESGSAGMKVQFNEGSECAFTPGTRGQIRSVDKTGARLGLEHGTASFKITRSASRRWLVDAGPFEVAVTGTVFTVSWDPIGEQFELKLRHGSVQVRGPVSAGEIALRSGQKLVVNLARAESVISEMPVGTGESEALAPAVSPPQTPAVAEKPAVPTPAPSIAKSVNDRRWGDQLARGQWDRILAEANRMGIENALAKASSEDLFALADAARYRRNPDLARAALLAERRRFPNSARTLDAIFLLGRAEELREHGAAQAIARYDEYLTRAPAGPFVGEALGRKMTLTDRLEGPASARPVAEEYLRRFPKGNYAGAARTLLRAP